MQSRRGGVGDGVSGARGVDLDPSDRAGVTALLRAWEGGDRDALDRLLPVVYGELRRMAVRVMARERPGHTLQPTAVIHEAYVQMIDQHRVQWQSRAHFFGIAATLMRRVLLRHAERKQASKRGAGVIHVPLLPELHVSRRRAVTIVALDDALTELMALDPRQGRVVELRFFGGLTVTETAHVLGIAPITVKREWRSAKAWFKQVLVEPSAAPSAKSPAGRLEAIG